MNAPEMFTLDDQTISDGNLLSYYEAIEHASHDMLVAARAGDWDTVVRLEGACAVLIAQLKHSSDAHPLGPNEVSHKTKIMQRILINDAEIRNLAEPWINDLSRMMGSEANPQKMH
ncbi:MAG: flagellar protein FliT [Aquabacterium sp.]|nr:flagellar protein FliT [Aquabacterium sp.]